jgi:hypothetical protein
MLVDLSQPYGDQGQAQAQESYGPFEQLQIAIAQVQAENAALRQENAELLRVGQALAEKVKTISALVQEAQRRGQAVTTGPAPVGSTRASEQVIDVGQQQQVEPEPPRDETPKQAEQRKQSWRWMDLWGDDGDFELDLRKR